MAMGEPCLTMTLLFITLRSICGCCDVLSLSVSCQGRRMEVTVQGVREGGGCCRVAPNHLHLPLSPFLWEWDGRCVGSGPPRRHGGERLTSDNLRALVHGHTDTGKDSYV